VLLLLLRCCVVALAYVRPVYTEEVLSAMCMVVCVYDSFIYALFYVFYQLACNVSAPLLLLCYVLCVIMRFMNGK
jgi:hypothetical protein